MQVLTSKHVLSYIFLLINHQVLVTAEKSSSWLSPRNVNYFVESLEPYFQNLTTQAGNASSTNPALQIFRETLSYSAGENEGWGKFLKRVGTSLLAETKGVAFKKNFLEGDFVNVLIAASPQFLKNTIKSKLQNSVWPLIDEQLQDIVKMIISHNSSERISTRQAELAFDPFVIGANGLLNILYLTVFTAFVTPTMGLENLFNPDYDFDYNSLNENVEGKEDLSSTTAASTTTTTIFYQPNDYEIENQELFNQHPESLDTSENAKIKDVQQAVAVSSSYLHYDGQRLRSSPSLILNEKVNPQERIYPYFKMYKPNVHV